MDNCLTKVELDAYHKLTLATKETKLEEIKSAAMHAQLALNSKFQMLLELLALLDHLLTADV
jgi:hypothetical protein